MKAVGNTLWLVSEKGLRLVLSILVNAFMARALGAEGFGYLSFAITLLTIVGVVTTLGLNRIVTREVVIALEAGQQQHIRKVIASAFFLRLLVTLLLVAVATLLLLTADVPQGHLYALALMSVLFMPVDVLDLHQQGLADMGVVSAARITAFITSSLARLLLCWFEVELTWFVAMLVIEYSLIAILLIIASWHKHHRFVLHWRYVQAKVAFSMLRESWPEILAGLAAILFVRIDQIFLQVMSGAASVGVYAAASRLSEAWYFVPAALVTATFPFIIRGKSLSAAEYLRRFRLITAVCVWLALIVAALVSWLGQRLVALIYGPDYALAAQVLAIHCWAGAFFCMGMTSGSMLASEKKLAWNLCRNLLGLVIAACGHLLFIPMWGVTGAAWGTLLGIFVAFFASDVLYRPMWPLLRIKIVSFNPFWLISEVRRLTSVRARD